MNGVELYIGIDPGKTTGMALWVPEDKILRLHSGGFWEVYHDVLQYDKDHTIIVMEDPNQNKPVFHRNGVNGRSVTRIAQNVGANKRDAQLLHEGWKMEGYSVYLYRPQGSKGRRGKVTKKEFEVITGYKGSSNQHTRDAAMLVFGLNATHMSKFDHS